MAELGRLLVIKLGDGIGSPETYTTVANTRSDTVSISGETVDVTVKDSGIQRELLAGAGIRSMSVSGSGTLNNTTQAKDLVGYALDGSHKSYQIVTALGTFTGLFEITAHESGGEYNGEQTASLTLESAGTIDFVAA